MGRAGFPAAILTSLLVALVAAAAASAQSGGTVAPGTEPAPAPPTGSSGGEPPAPSVRLVAARARPGKGFYFGVKPSRFALTLAAKQPTDLRIDVVSKGVGVLRSLYAPEVAPRSKTVVPWDGLTASGSPAQGKLRFVVRGVNGEPIQASKKFEGRTKFGLYDHIFPIRGAHGWGDGLGAGRGHRGQDLSAGCGTKLVAARGGKVQTVAYQGGGAGHYVVIDGYKNSYDYVYMHMLERASVREGQTVRTGQPIGRVGSTGRSTGCHLHFELWSAPGWYEGGEPIDPAPLLRAWDAYS